MYRQILKFFGLFIFVYLLLSFVLSRQDVKTTHADFFRSTSQSFIEAVMPKMFIRFDRADQENPHEVRVVFNSQSNVDAQVAEAQRLRQRNINLQVFDFNFDIFVLYVLPLSFLMALCLASPVPIKRRVIAVLIAYALLFAFCLVRLWILCLYQVSREQLDVYDYSAGTVNFLGTLSSFFTPGFIIITSVFIWILVTFRKKDIKRLGEVFEGRIKNKE